MAPQPLIVIAGMRNASGTAGATARRFAKAGWGVALIARDTSEVSLQNLAKTLNEAGGNTTLLSFDYSAASFASAFKAIQEKYKPSEYTIRATVFNGGHSVFGSFLDQTEEDIQDALSTNIAAAWFFARESILAIKDNEVTEAEGKKGTIIFTGATASIRGNTWTSSFSTVKHGIRALSQSLAKEFGKQGIHVAHAIIDGNIKTDQKLKQVGVEPEKRDSYVGLEPDHIGEAYYGLVHQNQSASTWELDLRPLGEKW